MATEKTPSVCVIIVNYNGTDYLQTAVDQLQTQTHKPDDIIIIDNNSQDGSADALDLSGLPQARLIRQDENLGFAKANNLAARQTSCEWLALLNPDTEARPDWISELLKATRRYPDVSMFASAQLNAANPRIIDGVGDAYFILGIPWRGGFGRNSEEMPAEGECFSPCGASAFFRRSVFLEADGFDESYFCYCEDVDLGFRLRLKGERCIFVPTAVIHHRGSAISGRYSHFTVKYGTRNRTRAYLTGMPILPLIVTLPGHILASLYLYLRAFRQPHARAMREGMLQALSMLPDIWKRRRQVQKTRTVSTLRLLRSMSWNVARLHGRKVHVWPAAAKAATDP